MHEGTISGTEGANIGAGRRSSSPSSPILTIASKDVVDAGRDRFLVAITVFLTAAALVSLVSGGIAMANDAATYAAAKETLLALGKDAAALAPPEFYPLRLLRGSVEQVEIIGAAIAILAGYRAGSVERGNRTLALILSRPVGRRQFLAGKLLAGLIQMSWVFLFVFGISAIALHLSSGVGLTLADVGRIALVWVASVVYAMIFHSLSLLFAMRARRLPNALLGAFVVWLLLVLIAPQIGDTLDPDNQVAGGVFRQLGIAKPEQTEIMKRFATFDTVRTGVEAASVTKHFERLEFALLGVKANDLGKSVVVVLQENGSRMLWLLLGAGGIGLVLLFLPIDINRLTEE